MTRASDVKRVSPLVVACVAATWVVWGSTYLAIKFALISFPPFFQMGTRFLAAGGILLLWTRLRGHPVPTRTQWRNACVVVAYASQIADRLAAEPETFASGFADPVAGVGLTVDAARNLRTIAEISGEEDMLAVGPAGLVREFPLSRLESACPG